MRQTTPHTDKDGPREEKKKVWAENESKEELDMPAAVLKEKGRVESPAVSLNKEGMVPEWIRDLMRSLRIEEEKKRKRPD